MRRYPGSSTGSKARRTAAEYDFPYPNRKYQQSAPILTAPAAGAATHLIELFMADDMIMVEVKFPKQVLDGLQACRRALQQLGIPESRQLQAGTPLSAPCLSRYTQS